jgi:hypothetical protein
MDILPAAELLSLDNPRSLRRQGVLVINPVQAECAGCLEWSYRFGYALLFMTWYLRNGTFYAYYFWKLQLQLFLR